MVCRWEYFWGFSVWVWLFWKPNRGASLDKIGVSYSLSLLRDCFIFDKGNRYRIVAFTWCHLFTEIHEQEKVKNTQHATCNMQYDTKWCRVRWLTGSIRYCCLMRSTGLYNRSIAQLNTILELSGVYGSTHYCSIVCVKYQLGNWLKMFKMCWWAHCPSCSADPDFSCTHTFSLRAW